MHDIKNTLSLFFDQSQMAIGIVQDSKIDYYGYLKEKGEITNIRNHQLTFEIGSITKVFTTYILAQLVLEQRVKLSDKIYAYLPLPSLKDTQITLLHLANHTSGLPRLPENLYTIPNYKEADPYRYYTEESLLDYFENHLKLVSPAGETFAYSNLGSGVLSYVLSKIEKKPFTQLVQERIFDPFRMTNSTFEAKKTPAPLVQGLDKEGKVTENWNGGILNGCIGILSTTEDMGKFIQASFDLDNQAFNLQFQPTQTISSENHLIGLAWGIRHWQTGITTYNHGGGSNGYTAFLKVNRRDRYGIILLTNISAFHEKISTLEPLSNQLIQKKL